MGKLEWGIALLGKKGAIKEGFKQLEIGEMLELQLDGKKGTVSFSVDLTGEEKPIGLKAKYRLTEKNGESFIEIRSLIIDRDWINTLTHMLLERNDNSFLIPSGAEKYLKLLR